MGAGCDYDEYLHRTETTEKIMEMALDVLKGMNQNGITAEQLSSVKGYVKDTYPRQSLETSDQLAKGI
jgi:hypothetical protein